MYTRNGHPRFRAASLRIKGNRWKFPSDGGVQVDGAGRGRSEV